MRNRSVLLNAVVAAVAAVVLSFVPLSTLLGGAIGGFLQGADAREGVIVGALAGLLTLLPFGAIGFGVLFVLGIVGAGGAPIEGIVVFFVFALVIAVVAFLYTVGLSALGGFLGATLADEYPGRRSSVRETIGLDSRPPRGARESPGSNESLESREPPEPGRRDSDRFEE